MATGELPPLYRHPSPPREPSSPTATNPITETILSSGTTETILSSALNPIKNHLALYPAPSTPPTDIPERQTAPEAPREPP
ncbi:hypothetical protein P152DRAFT_485751 [Eremomyces bilateralis CBS 781.70]|uniref:Uncharacterized protein n=1 Tax=Eremomyces bilateralis CBS 781.70 TaxID=1392243 RepID=A0A6G1FQV7_9PEZI|nr:uncharacterized protein P152DRAFT_485751 [Eremomyces bilateralis CBS 781.70]KAF1808042.1 hypothetical protein P152DRAFT_485751 [Eremomyces bilateralis CBS 781.70]